MRAPQYSDDDFTQGLLSLMPQGRAWPKEPDALQSRIISYLAPSFRRSSDAGQRLIIDGFPSSAYALLPDWEASLGLPDPVLGMASTVQGRQAQVTTKLIATGGQSAPYFTAYAAALGYTVNVVNFTPFRLGQCRMGCQLGSQDWAHTWAIRAIANQITTYKTGRSAMGEPLQAWGDRTLEQMLIRVMPAHTVLLFQYR